MTILTIKAMLIVIVICTNKTATGQYTCENKLPNNVARSCFTVAGNDQNDTSNCTELGQMPCIVAVFFHTAPIDVSGLDKLAIEIYISVGSWTVLNISPDKTSLSNYIQMDCSTNGSNVTLHSDVQDINHQTSAPATTGPVITCRTVLTATQSEASRTLNSFDLRNDHYVHLSYGRLINGNYTVTGDKTSVLPYKFKPGVGSWSPILSTSTPLPITTGTMGQLDDDNSTLVLVLIILVLVVFVVAAVVTVYICYFGRKVSTRFSSAGETADITINESHASGFKG